MKQILFLLLVLVGFAASGQSCIVGNIAGYTVPVMGQVQSTGDTSCWYWNRDEVMDYVATHGGGSSKPDTVALSPIRCANGGSVISNQDTSYQYVIPCNLLLYAWDVESTPSGTDSFDVKLSNTSVIGSGNNPHILAGVTSGITAISGWTTTQFHAGDRINILVKGTPLNTIVGTLILYGIKEN